jgi:biotin carboxylase
MKSKCIIFVEASATGAGEVACAYAKQIGLVVVLLSGNPESYDPRILQHCDVAITVDTTCASALVACAAAISNNFVIAGVATTSDFHVVHTAALATWLGLPSNHPNAVDRIKNKFKMREAIARIAPDLNPAYTIAHTFDDAHGFSVVVGYPLVAKPLTGNDSLHVKRIDSGAELRAYFYRRPYWGKDVSGQAFAQGVLIEEAIGGTEYCLDVLRSRGGDPVVIGAFVKKISGEDTRNFIKIGACFPAGDHETTQLSSALVPIIDALGFEVGAINVDCKIVDGQIKILEMNPRLVGDQMGSHMIEIATGQNPAHAIVDIACGLPLRWAPTRSRGVAIHRLTMPRSGYFDGIENAESLKRHEGVEAVNQLAVKGRWVDKAESNQGVVGSIIVSHSSASEAMMLASRFAADAKIRVAPGVQ